MTRTTHRKRHARTDVLTGAYARLRREGTPTFVTSHEAYRMTDGRVGTKGDHNLRHGFTLMALVKKADGEVHSLADDPATCTHAEPLPVPGLDDVTVCMDCGHTSVPEPDGADDGTTGQTRAEVQPPKSRVPALSLTALNRMRIVDLRSWAERHYSTTFKSRMRKAEIVRAILDLQNGN